MRKSNLTYEELIELAPKDRPFQIEVESNPFNKGKKQVLWAYIDTGELETCGMLQDQINDVDYEGFGNEWGNIYKGTFTLIDEYRNMYEKPEVLKVGTEVEILESAKEIGEGYKQETYIGKIGRIQLIQDDYTGLCYGVFFDESNRLIGFPHCCVRPVEKVEQEEEIITFSGKKYKLIEE